MPAGAAALRDKRDVAGYRTADGIGMACDGRLVSINKADTDKSVEIDFILSSFFQSSRYQNATCQKRDLPKTKVPPPAMPAPMPAPPTPMTPAMPAAHLFDMRLIEIILRRERRLRCLPGFVRFLRHQRLRCERRCFDNLGGRSYRNSARREAKSDFQEMTAFHLILLR